MENFVRNFQANFIQTNIINDASKCNEIFIDNHKKFTLLHNNIRSISKNFDNFQTMVHQINTTLDCIILSETWRIYDTNLFYFEGYETIYNKGDLNQNDGVIVFLKNDYNYDTEIIKIHESMALKITIKMGVNEKLILTCIYRSPASCVDEFNNHLKNYLETHTRNKHQHILVGDININILSDTEHSQTYLNILGEQDFHSCVNVYTRVQGESKSCIDHLFVKNINKQPPLSVVLESHVTDHYTILFQFEMDNKVNNDKEEHFVRHINFKELKKKLSQLTWTDVYNCPNVETATNVFIEQLTYNVNMCTKQRVIKTIKKKTWITSGLIKSIKRRDELYKKWQRDKENRTLLEDFKIYRNKLNNLIKQTKNAYYIDKINLNKKDPKQLWNTVNEVYNKSKKNIDIKEIKTENGIVTMDKKTIANSFVNFFSNIGIKLASKINKPEQFIENKKEVANSIFLVETNESEIKKIIQNLKKHKAPGLDNITSNTLQQIVDYVIKPLCYICNKIISTGEYPKAFKAALIKPVFKSGDRMEIGNYRPISLISTVAKIVETLIKNRVTGYLEKYNILNNSQFGFREARSTQDAIAYLTGKIYKAIDDSQPAICIFVDLAKAFDTVSHPLLLQALEQIGFRGVAHKLMKNYLADREQCVKIKDFISDMRKVEYGVPQGTVLGPILFNIYLNNLFQQGSSGQIVSFADDTAILYTADSWETLLAKAEKDLKKIKQWFDLRLLTINFSKTKYVPFSINKITALPPLKISDGDGNNFEIPAVNEIKYLGITIDCYLRWDKHLRNLTQKIRSLLAKFKYFKQLLNIKQLRIMYYAFVESQLRYGILAWGGAYNSHLKNAETLQKWVLKIIYGKELAYPSDNLYQLASVLDIRQLYCSAILLNQKTLKSKNQIEHQYSTRYKDNSYHVPKVTKTIAQRCHTYLGPRLYNILPANIKTINSIDNFKNKIRKWLLNLPRLTTHQFIDLKNTYP